MSVRPMRFQVWTLYTSKIWVASCCMGFLLLIDAASKYQHSQPSSHSPSHPAAKNHNLFSLTQQALLARSPRTHQIPQLRPCRFQRSRKIVPLSLTGRLKESLAQFLDPELQDTSSKERDWESLRDSGGRSVIACIFLISKILNTIFY